MLSKKRILARVLLSVLILLMVIGAHMAANAMEITLAWDLNDPTENVTSYRIYWATNEFTNDSRPYGDNCPVEVYISDLENYENYSEYDVDENTAIYTLYLDDLNEDEVYYLAIQAVSENGASDISGLVNTGDGGNSVGGDSGGSGGSGGGCFIRVIR